MEIRICAARARDFVEFKHIENELGEELAASAVYSLTWFRKGFRSTPEVLRDMAEAKTTLETKDSRLATELASCLVRLHATAETVAEDGALRRLSVVSPRLSEVPAEIEETCRRYIDIEFENLDRADRFESSDPEAFDRQLKIIQSELGIRASTRSR